MANITPNSTIKLLTNVPLDKTYDHTIYFTSALAQEQYFSSLVKYSYLNYTYVRQDRRLKVQAPVGANLYDCNYLMFKNTSFENKWFYAFVTHVEYDNNLTWLVDFELDDMQTWFFDYELENCFVEREHSATDEIGDNLVPENVETGDYISDGLTRCADTGSATESLLEDYSLVFGCTFDTSYNDYWGGYYRGMYSGLKLIDFPFPKPATTSNIQTFVTTVQNFVDGAVSAGKIDGIITCFVCPTALVSSDTSTASTMGFSKTINLTTIDEITHDPQEAYTPKNKKLFTYPYNYMFVTNFQGTSCEYHFEYFNRPASTPNSLGFTLEGNYTANPEIVLTPLNYKGVPVNYDERMSLGKYPLLPFASDVYKAWLSMDASGQWLGGATGTIAGAVVGSAIAPGVGTVIGGFAGGIISLISSTISQGYQKDKAPPQNNGTTSGAHALASIRLIDFGFMQKHVRPEFAKIIDDFFTMFGYATHRCKIPNRNVRPHWTYTKTIGCCIKGSVPADSMAHICQIYDKGITFWKNGSEVGNYSLDNRPV